MSDVVLVGIIGLASAVIGGAIAQLGPIIMHKIKRKDDKADAKERDNEAIKTALKWVMYDRVRFLGQKYIADGAVDFDDRRILHEMHKSYHDGLGGNGDLDVLMNQVNSLPLK